MLRRLPRRIAEGGFERRTAAIPDMKKIVKYFTRILLQKAIQPPPAGVGFWEGVSPPPIRRKFRKV